MYWMIIIWGASQLVLVDDPFNTKQACEEAAQAYQQKLELDKSNNPDDWQSCIRLPNYMPEPIVALLAVNQTKRTVQVLHTEYSTRVFGEECYRLQESALVKQAVIIRRLETEQDIWLACSQFKINPDR